METGHRSIKAIFFIERNEKHKFDYCGYHINLLLTKPLKNLNENTKKYLQKCYTF